MNTINLILGLFFIGIGFLVKSSPDLIAGYNTMPKNKKKNVDIEGLSTFMRNGFISIGVIVIMGSYIFVWIGLETIATTVVPLVILLGVTIMVVMAQKFDRNRGKGKRTKLTYGTLGVLLLLVFGSMAYGYLPTKTILSDKRIEFKGMYGFDLGISDIGNVELLPKLPKINRRINGYSFGAIRKGMFNLEDFGESRLLLESDRPPYLLISKSNGDKVVVNYKDTPRTEELYGKIQALISSNPPHMKHRNNCPFLSKT